MRKLRIGGVPEHFNYPWHLCLKEGLFDDLDIDVEWITFGGGTGAMNKALRNDEVDMCVILTEGVINDIFHGNKTKILSSYVDSPLIWGIHTSSDNPLNPDEDNLFDLKFAISRFGSGSHLMPQIHAFSQNEVIEDSQFVVINNISGAVKSLSNLDSDLFYWEKFTTKPLVLSGEFKRVGEFKPPWSCFVLAASEKAINEFGVTLKHVSEVVLNRAQKLYQAENASEVISKEYHLSEDDVTEWLADLQWSEKFHINKAMLDSVKNELEKCGMIESTSKINIDQFVFEFTSLDLPKNK